MTARAPAAAARAMGGDADLVLDAGALAAALAPFHPVRGAAAGPPGAAGERDGPAGITGATLDSRAVKPGDLFVALAGARTHGARFAAAALEAGAAIVLVGRAGAAELAPGTDMSRVLWVDDAVRALAALARAARRRAGDRPVVAVTGSFGKTTTKELVAAALGTSLRVHRTPGNFNNQLGVPITLLGFAPRHEAAVVELGMSAPGEIRVLAELARPTIGVVTGVGRAHLAGLGTRRAVIAAKLELAGTLPPRGALVLPATAPDLLAAARATGVRLKTVAPAAGPGPSPAGAADLVADGIEIGSDTVRFRATGLGLDRLPVVLPAPARALVTNALLALAVGVELGLAGGAMARGLASARLPERRLTVRRAGGLLILDDCYNANPESMAAALATLAELEVERRIGVLGDMRELGDETAAAHQELGERAARELDLLFLIGDEADRVAAAARAAGLPGTQVLIAADRAALVRAVTAQVRAGDGILVKASRALALEAVVEALVRAAAPAGEGT